jgi:hypothetical protein
MFRWYCGCIEPLQQGPLWRRFDAKAPCCHLGEDHFQCASLTPEKASRRLCLQSPRAFCIRSEDAAEAEGCRELVIMVAS